MKTTYLILFTMGGMKVETRMISSVKEPAVIVREFIRRRKNVNVVGIYKLEACNVELS